MIKLTTPHRDLASFGSGAYGASRGSRSHRGVDFAAAAKSKVHSLFHGTVTKLGQVYPDTHSYRYVQVTNLDGFDIRYFYVKPGVVEGDVVDKDEFIGIVQNLDPRYKGITNHIHLEIRTPNGEYVNPEEYLRGNDA